MAQLDPENKGYAFLVKYLKFRMFTQVKTRERQVCTRFREGDLSSLLIEFEDPSKAKTLNFASMIFGKEVKKDPVTSKDCELKGIYKRL
jgi:16S rRNA C1402 N4-methylase RsmH